MMLGPDLAFLGSSPRSPGPRVMTDRPGLLYAIALVLSRYGVSLHTAKIATLGERAEDVFVVSGSALANAKTVLQLETDLLKALQA